MAALHRRQRGGEHDLRERLPQCRPLELGFAKRGILVGGLPVEHRLVQPSSHEVDADVSDLVDPEAEDRGIGHRPVEAAIRPDDVAIE